MIKTDGMIDVLQSMAKQNQENLELSKLAYKSDLTYGKLYRENGFARLLVDIPSVDATREWLDIRGDDDNYCLSYMKRLNAKHCFRSALKWANVYGGSIAVIMFNDGEENLEKPVNENSIDSIKGLKVFDRSFIHFDNDYLTPEIYNVRSLDGTKLNRIHESRILRFDGNEVPPMDLTITYGWGASVYDNCLEQISRLDDALNNASGIVADFVQTTISMKGLSTILSSADGEEQIKQRMRVLNQSRSVLKTWLLDGDEQFNKVTSNVSGLGELINKFMMALSSVSGIPVSRLYGQAPQGLNSTGEGEMRFYYDKIKGEQESKLLPPLEKLLRYITLCKDFKGGDYESYHIDFSPLEQQNEAEKATILKSIAETDNLNIMNGLYGPEHAAKRYVNGQFTIIPSVEKEYIEALGE